MYPASKNVAAIIVQALEEVPSKFAGVFVNNDDGHVYFIPRAVFIDTDGDFLLVKKDLLHPVSRLTVVELKALQSACDKQMIPLMELEEATDTYNASNIHINHVVTPEDESDKDSHVDSVMSLSTLNTPDSPATSVHDQLPMELERMTAYLNDVQHTFNEQVNGMRRTLGGFQTALGELTAERDAAKLEAVQATERSTTAEAEVELLRAQLEKMGKEKEAMAAELKNAHTNLTRKDMQIKLMDLRVVALGTIVQRYDKLLTPPGNPWHDDVVSAFDKMLAGKKHVGLSSSKYARQTRRLPAAPRPAPPPPPQTAPSAGSVVPPKPTTPTPAPAAPGLALAQGANSGVVAFRRFDPNAYGNPCKRSASSSKSAVMIR